MGLKLYVIDSDEKQVIDSNGYNVIVGFTELSYSGDITLTLTPESTYYAPKLDYTPDATLVQTIKYNTLVTDAPYGEERRRNKWASPRRSWVLNYNNVLGATADGIISYYNSRQNLHSFEWENPIDDTSYRVRFVENSIKRDHIGNDRYNIQVGLVEIL